MMRVLLTGIVMAGFGRLAAASLGLVVEPQFDGRPLRLASLRYQSAGGERFSITRLSMLLDGFALRRDDGTWIELADQSAWIDAASWRTATRLEGIPEANYTRLRFAVGLDRETNHGDPARYPAGHPLNPAVNGLHWSWQGGYIFLALEGRYRKADGELGGYVFHLANDWNRTVVELPVELEVAGPGLISIAFDLGALFADEGGIAFTRDGDSTHSQEGDELAEKMRATLAEAFEVRRVLGSAPREAEDVPKPIDVPEGAKEYRVAWNRAFPRPRLPEDNPLLEERVALGEKLFHETLLSRDGSLSCASCHDRNHAFADPRRFSAGVDGRAGARNAMPLFNLAWKQRFFWDGRAPSLREQALMPIQDHAEMDESLGRVTAKLREAPGYPEAFERAFATREITPERIGLALENFLLTLISHDSKFDRALQGTATLSEPERRGFELFMTEHEPRSGRYGADCFHCHGGALFSDRRFHNNGLYDASDLGRFAVTKGESDKGKFATPSLRNVALTAPYMHDGRFATLEEVVEHYNSGVVRSESLDPTLAKHPRAGLGLSEADKQALVAFLHALTDPQYRESDRQARNTDP